jgi:hypothetical protein
MWIWYGCFVQTYNDEIKKEKSKWKLF